MIIVNTQTLSGPLEEVLKWKKRGIPFHLEWVLGMQGMWHHSLVQNDMVSYAELSSL